MWCILCTEYGDDPAAYWMGKQAFVKGVVERARVNRDRTRMVDTIDAVIFDLDGGITWNVSRK